MSSSCPKDIPTPWQSCEPYIRHNHEAPSHMIYHKPFMQSLLIKSSVITHTALHHKSFLICIIAFCCIVCKACIKGTPCCTPRLAVFYVAQVSGLWVRFYLTGQSGSRHCLWDALHGRLVIARNRDGVVLRNHTSWSASYACNKIYLVHVCKILSMQHMTTPAGKIGWSVMYASLVSGVKFISNM